MMLARVAGRVNRVKASRNAPRLDQHIDQHASLPPSSYNSPSAPVSRRDPLKPNHLLTTNMLRPPAAASNPGCASPRARLISTPAHAPCVLSSGTILGVWSAFVEHRLDADADGRLAVSLTRCPHKRETCRNRAAHPRHDVSYITNAEGAHSFILSSSTRILTDITCICAISYSTNLQRLRLLQGAHPTGSSLVSTPSDTLSLSTSTSPHLPRLRLPLMRTVGQAAPPAASE